MISSRLWSLGWILACLTNDQVSADFVKKVHVIFMNHLDVGYDGIKGTGFINNVLNQYFNVYFPRAIKVSEDLRDQGYVENFIYTTHPWLVSLYVDCPPEFWLNGIKLKCPSPEALSNFTKAVSRGDITWHAGPMNLQPEVFPEWLLKAGFDIGIDLDKKFGKKRDFKVMSQRDVPGLTRAVIPILVEKGIHAVTVGVNNMSPPPAVPNPTFRWVQTTSAGNSEVMAMWHPGGYPDNPGPNPKTPGGLSRKDCVVIPGFEDALCFAFRTDNSGPPMDIQEVLHYYELLRAEFPDAEIKGSYLEDFVAALSLVKDKLPVFDGEVSDTWLMGVSSDPRKMAEYRAVTRVLGKWYNASGGNDVVFKNASRFLVKVAEHTWGLSSTYDTSNWTNADFERVRKGKNFQNCEGSWLEQRNLTYIAIDILRQNKHPSYNNIIQALKEVQASVPDLTGYAKSSTSSFQCGSMSITFGKDGSLIYLKDGITQKVWASADNPLGKFQYFTYNATDYEYFYSLYNYKPNVTFGFSKTNMTQCAHPESKEWAFVVDGIYYRKAEAAKNICDIYAHIKPQDSRSYTYYGAPQEVWIRYRSEDTKRGLLVDLTLLNKATTRLPEAIFFTFQPPPQESYKWLLYKLGSFVSPHHVVLNGSQYLHGVGDHGTFFCQKDNIRVCAEEGMGVYSKDVPIVAISTKNHPPNPFPVPLAPFTDYVKGISYMLYNNMWDTNYIYWYPYMKMDRNFKARFEIWSYKNWKQN